ncbi:conserved hypothetical protein [Nesidiocoris tenuis]|uniref:PHD-type domain-containing protein n=1 Tax=Nesidiocoris tenuis TaxID=355587 RepID=A0ABN7B144_9HEMI|nr:conserved hypothetical protein [Nesidiocoris tenuis]
MDCAFCSRDLFSPKKTASCMRCKASFHPQCTRIKTLENYRKMRLEAREKWECDKCKEGSPSSLGGASSESSDAEEDANRRTRASGGGEFNSEINRKLDQLLGLPGEIRDLKTSMNYMSAQFDSFVEDMSSLKTSVKGILKENAELKDTVKELQQKVDLLEQNSRNANVEIHGVPETNNEDCSKIVKAASNALKVDCGTISRAFRVGAVRKDRPRKILAILNSSDARENLVRTARAEKSLTAKNLVSEWPKERVYINENLTAFRAELLRRAKAKGKEKGYKFIWIKNFAVHARKSEGERVYVIKSLEDIERM